jgi:hypothetical protein
VTSYSRPRNSAKSVNTELSSAEMGAAMRKSCDGSGAKLGAADPLKSARRVPEASERRPLKRRGSRHGGCPPTLGSNTGSKRSRSARLARLLRWFLCAFWWGGGLAPAPHTNRSHSPLSCLVPLFVLLVMTDFRRLPRSSVGIRNVGRGLPRRLGIWPVWWRPRDRFLDR